MNHLLLLVVPFIVLQSSTTAVDLLAPLLSPILEGVCKDVTCGQGTCKPTNTSIIPYECECSPGWKQVANFNDDDDHFLKVLPCVIPNCTLNYSCSQAPSPVQEKENRGNGSIFDVCQWTDCGGGKCVATSPFTRKCECSEGYYNLLNLTFSPCFRDCSLGMDCKNLGIGRPSPPPPSLPTDSTNQASYRLEGSYDWLVLTFALMFI
ncbi:hypothetical protein QVD17_02209 [Tagetes erecta]|uniref:Uncharacterized protein n=1 Tax=Tagetes erecta TaxID=13708 RepID=A0AAD8P8M9_TARER|nr:hypothetical protein QVD17_02209 [Tagetes erecta]